jgi:hypothetical protein
MIENVEAKYTEAANNNRLIAAGPERCLLAEAMADLSDTSEQPFVHVGSTGVCNDFEVATNGKDTVALYWDGWVWSGVLV